MQNRKCDLSDISVIGCTTNHVKPLNILGVFLGVFCRLHYNLAQIIISKRLTKNAK
jgi:hypothetical protein